MSAARPTARRILGQVIYIFVFFSLAFAVLPARAAPGELVLERVMLSSGGVGYFEYSAEVEGDTELALKVNLDQVDDVLKSIVIYDDAGGVGQVRLPGREPLTQVFRDLPFGPDALESPAALLNSLQGAEVRATGDRDLVGRILGARAETVTLPNGLGTTVRHRVSLITPEGVRQFILEQAETVAFTDPELQAQVNEALEAIAAHRVQDSRTLKIAAEGEGRRTVRVGYVIAVPLWKTSYRLRLPAVGEEGPARLRGWAHVDNLSGQDWNGVELTLVSGNPVTFRQALYSAYFVDRPEVPVEVLGRVLPRLDQGVIASREKKAVGAGGQAFDQEFRLQRPAQRLLGELHLVGAQLLTVGLRLAAMVRAAVPDGRARNDQRRPPGFALRRLEGVANRLPVVAVGAHHVPTVRFEALLHVFAEREAGRSVDRDLVVVIHVDQVAQAQVSGQRCGLGRDAFHQIAVATNAVDEVAAGATAATKPGARHARRQRHANTVREALSQRSGRNLDTGRVTVFRVARRLGAELAEAGQVVEGEIVAVEVEQRVQQHRGVTVRQHETIPKRPLRIARIKAQVLVPDFEGDARQPHRSAGVAGARPFDGVHGQEANGVLNALA